MNLNNVRERLVADEYKAMDYHVAKTGAPDFLMTKQRDDGSYVDIRFIEVKSMTDKPTYNQRLWGQTIKHLGGNYEVRRVA